MPHATRSGDVLGDRYLLSDLLTESGSGRFWRAHDRVLQRHVAIHVIAADDQRAPSLMEAARRASTVHDRRILRVLDAEVNDEVCYVVNEWAWGSSVDHVVEATTLGPRRAAWVVAEVADSIAVAHAAGVPHGRLAPENVLVDRSGNIRLIGHGVDAALHGKTNTRAATDVCDLAGLLYCLLTGRWAGLSESAVPTAPREHGEVLRPRRVRAGVPRPIDLLCDAVLHPHTVPRSLDLGDIHTARGIATYLEEYVGDPAGLQEALLGDIPPVPSGGIVDLPPVPEIAVEDDVPTTYTPAVRPLAPKPAPEPEPVAEEPKDETPPEQRGEAPTQAGMPIFDETGDVSWLERRTEPVPPPPPFEDPPERPLFAPDPPDGVPRRPRTPPPRPMPTPSTPSTASDDSELSDSSSTRLRRAEGGFWPFAGGTGHGDTGSGLYAIGTEDGHVPGRGWLRLATGLAVVLLLVVAVVVATSVPSGDGGTEPGEDTSTSSTPSPDTPSSAAAQPLSGITASALDPQGDGGENDDEASLAVDGKPDTAWTTQSYFDQFGPDGGLKTGVGLTLDLGQEREVSTVDLRLDGAPTAVEVYSSDEPPSDVVGLTRVAAGTAEGTDLSLDPELDDGEPVTARYLVVWLTSLPAAGAEFRGSIAEVVVRGG